MAKIAGTFKVTKAAAPFESCVACFKGDTRTAVMLEGEAEFHIAALHHLSGIPLEQADGTVLVAAEHELGCDPGMVPAGRFQLGFRLCTDCAAKTGATIVDLKAAEKGEPVFVYQQLLEGPYSSG